MTDDTLLLRQVHPSWIQLGRITSQLFKPTPKDQKRLSVYDGDQMTAKDSCIHFTEQLRHSSVGVMAVTVAECQALDLPAESDPEPFPAHAIIRFDNCDPNSHVEKKAKVLKTKAESRGWLYQTEAAA